MRAPFHRSTVEAITQAKAEPAWMSAFRLRAWETYERLGPALEQDAFLNRLEAFSSPPAAGVPSQQWPAGLRQVIEERGDEEGLIVQRDSTVLSRSLTKEQAKRGVLFCDLETAVKTMPDLVRRAFAQVAVGNDRTTTLNTAFWTGGAFLFVPAHVEVQLPFHACYWMTSPRAAMFPRALILTERHSEVTFVDDFLSNAWEQPALALSVAEIVVGEHAEVRYTQIHHWGSGVSHAARQESRTASTGRLHVTQISGHRPVATLERAAELYPEVR